MAAPIILPILSVLRSAGINAAGQAMNGLSGNMKGLAANIGRAAGAFAAFQGITTAQDFLANAAGSAQRLERNMVALDQVFEEQSITMQGFVRDIEAYGMSQEQAAKASVFTGSVLKQSGFTIEETANQTQRLVKLAVDLSATFGYDVQEALLGMTALFRGEYDPIEKFGVAMKQNEINAELAARGLDDLEGSERRLAEQQIRLQFLFERGGDAIGAYTRLSETLFVQQTQLTAEFANLQAAAGDRLQQPLANLIESFREIMNDAGPGIIETVDGLGGALESVTPFLEQFGNFVFELIELINPVVQILNVALSPAFLVLEKTFQGLNAVLNFTNELFAAGGTYLDIWADRVERLVNEDNMPFFAWVLEQVEKRANGVDMAYQNVLDALVDFNNAHRTGKELADAFIRSLEEEEKRLMALKPAAEAAAGAIQTLFMSEVTGRVTSREGVAYASRYEAMAEALGGRFPELLEKEKESGSVAKATTDYVAEFFNGLTESIEQESARLKLQDLGLSEAFIDQILGSADWEGVFDIILEGGKELARELQQDFYKTAEGIRELAATAADIKALEDAIAPLQERLEQMQKDLEDGKPFEDATARFEKFKRSVNVSVDALQTYEREIGKFEAATRSDLDRIEQQLQNAFDQGYLLEEAKNDLMAYARAELNVLMQIQRQRDQLIARRDAAADTIFNVAKAVAASGQITNLLSNVQDKITEVQVSETFEDIVKTAGSLEGFRVTLTRNYTEVIEETVNKSNALVNGFQAVINRTKAFIANLKELRELGLDPFLFKQLVDAGAEAGGATAAALVEGGAATVSEVNSLQAELEALGVQMGEQTYEVTKNAGEQFVSGVVDGLNSEIDEVERVALAMANSFNQTFAVSMELGLERAFDVIISHIKDEFQQLMNELKSEIAALENELAAITGTPTSPGTTGAYGIYSNVPDGNGGRTEGFMPIPQEELDFLRSVGMLPDTSAMASTSSASTTVNNYVINTTNPLDSSYAAKQTVENQANFQSSNGDIRVVTSGVGN